MLRHPTSNILCLLLSPEPVSRSKSSSPEPHRAYKKIVLEPVPIHRGSSSYQMYSGESSALEPLAAIEQDVVTEEASKGKSAYQDINESIPLDKFDKDKVDSEDNPPQELHIFDKPEVKLSSSDMKHEKLLGQADAGVSKPLPGEVHVAPSPRYELECLYIPDFMKEKAGQAATAALTHAYTADDLSTAGPAEESNLPVATPECEQPPKYFLEYMYVPEFFRSEARRETSKSVGRITDQQKEAASAPSNACQRK
ncbi:hypothetical protein HPB51_021291 [Rhipicephalus microplus]|uniref:Uncharacterized protein n=1 Tax=Rhipicephalus microplus TaxID=6941 RepID=A0A9J6F7T6_RHIMP|nr:hypothetical protein HPB51_021291 [Rhipicephalus microplus]